MHVFLVESSTPDWEALRTLCARANQVLVFFYSEGVRLIEAGIPPVENPILEYKFCVSSADERGIAAASWCSKSSLTEWFHALRETAPLNEAGISICVENYVTDILLTEELVHYIIGATLLFTVTVILQGEGTKNILESNPHHQAWLALPWYDISNIYADTEEKPVIDTKPLTPEFINTCTLQMNWRP